MCCPHACSITPERSTDTLAISGIEKLLTAELFVLAVGSRMRRRQTHGSFVRARIPHAWMHHHPALINGVRGQGIVEGQR